MGVELRHPPASSLQTPASSLYNARMDTDAALADPLLAGLNESQRTAATHGEDPLLIVAGAGTGKTRALVHRVAYLIGRGVDPQRILLLTFTRRAAAEMLRRVDETLALSQSQNIAPTTGRGEPAANTDNPTPSPDRHEVATTSHIPDIAARLAQARQRQQNPAGKKVWGGTFHAVAARLLRIYARPLGLATDFVIHDRPDSEDLLDVVRTGLGLSKKEKRFPKKRTCLAIYSHCVNAQRQLSEVLQDHYPWCEDFQEELKELFEKYVERKEKAAVLDYDDLLLFFASMVEHPGVGRKVRERFEHVLVDEYQDTNILQARILKGLCPDGRGLTVVGDDAQSIYSFRAATVENILNFPNQFPNTRVVKLEQNYRSTPQIIAITNRVIAEAERRHEKELHAVCRAGEKPQLLICEDEDEQSDAIVRRTLDHYEGGLELRRQAVLFRASHHSLLLETELTRKNIPYVKYGGLKFLEAAHIKDFLSILRLAENPRDLVAGSRILTMLPGIGPKGASRLMDTLIDSGGDFVVWQSAKVPPGAQEHFKNLVALMRKITGATGPPLPAQVHAAAQFYRPLLEEKYDNTQPRLADLQRMEEIAGRYKSRQNLLSELALDPPETTEDLAGPPLLDEDWLTLSTIHSAKGLEWDVVHVIHASDGCIPSDMATGKPEQIDEERRLFYVALTRAKRHLYVHCPLRYYQGAGRRMGDRYGMSQLTRFISKETKDLFEVRTPFHDLVEGRNGDRTDEAHEGAMHGPRGPTFDPRGASKGLWG